MEHQSVMSSIKISRAAGGVVVQNFSHRKRNPIISLLISLSGSQILELLDYDITLSGVQSVNNRLRAVNRAGSQERNSD
jgi:hypothetical protein